MAYIKTTGETLNDIEDVFYSLDKHLGMEYTDEVKSILIDDDIEDYKKEIKKLNDIIEDNDRYTDGLQNAISTAYNSVREFMEYVENSKRLDRKKIIKWIQTIKYDLNG